MKERNKIYIDVFKAIVNKDKYCIKINTDKNIMYKNPNSEIIRDNKNPVSEIIHDIYKEFIERKYVASEEEVSKVERHLYHYYLERYYIEIKKGKKEKCE